MTIIELTNKKEKLLEELASNADWSSLHAISALSAELEYDPQYEQGENGIEDEKASAGCPQGDRESPLDRP